MSYNQQNVFMLASTHYYQLCSSQLDKIDDNVDDENDFSLICVHKTMCPPHQGYIFSINQLSLLAMLQRGHSHSHTNTFKVQCRIFH